MERTLVICLVVSVCIGCAGVYREDWPNESYRQVIDPGPHDQPKNIFILFDGTRNDKLTETNLARLAQILRYEERPENRVFYVSGVGATDKPLTGSALGRGMEERILLGYEYIAQHYQKNDKLIIMGFSRGSHQARALAGLLSYSGIPDFTNGMSNKVDMAALGNSVIEYTKDRSDADYLDYWRAWSPSESKPVLDLCSDPNGDCVSKRLEKYGVDSMRPIQVDFLGIWDTVPGSSFKEFGICKEEVDGRNGDRYKSDSYPPIRRISHAVSIDEKRSKFRLLQICDAINPKYTSTIQMWFPGAHADVGGGYSDSRLLSGISLNWMIEELSKTYTPAAKYSEVPASATALAHWSIGDKPANVGSECEDRAIPANDPVHPSYQERIQAAPVPVRANFYQNGMEKSHDKRSYYVLPYPIACPGPEPEDSSLISLD